MLFSPSISSALHEVDVGCIVRYLGSDLKVDEGHYLRYGDIRVIEGLIADQALISSHDGLRLGFVPLTQLEHVEDFRVYFDNGLVH